MRRQNHSCDQCRRAKRACDAPLLASALRASLPSESIGQEQRIESCSYCRKTKKHCTLYWARSQLRVGSGDSRARGNASSGRHHRVDQRAALRADAIGHHATELFNLVQTPAQYQDPVQQALLTPSPEAISPRRDSSHGSIPLTVETFSGTASQYGFQELHDGSHGDPGNSSRDPDSIFTTLPERDLQSNTFEDPYCPLPSFSQDHSDTGDFAFSSYHARDAMGIAPQAADQLQPDTDWLQNSYNPLSPYSAAHMMISRTDNNFISHNLLHVYHDVFEHSLSCWVSEETCPYKMPPRSRTGSLGMARPQRVNLMQESGLVHREWGAVWSNRIYARVIRLDRVAQSCNIIRLTRSENQLVTKALHLAMMAFSSQWAHQSRRERERYSSAFASENQDINCSDDLAEEFDRLIQRSFWEQARKALDDCAELECYRVVCAELIFGLTQKPWERDDPTLDINGSVSADFEHGAYGVKASAVAQVRSIISKDGPPVFIEKAARKVHALKSRFEAVETGLAKARKDHSDAYEQDPRTAISTRDRETAGFVHWLAVMFDTISSSIHQRPVVVIDEDCQHDAAGEVVLAEPECDEGRNGLRAQRWSISHFIQDDPNGPMQPLRWPCSYEDAARAVTRSGPVKIMLYRHVSYLQDAIRRGQLGEPIEDIIRNAVLVYRYWNATYGVFFRDLIDNYSTVPPRIQSWFFCILAHWHLAALILADLIESIDDSKLGDHQARQRRLGAATVDTIRRVSSGELSELARITTPPDWAEWTNPPSPQLPEFHPAVNQGAILTEPWTIILIRAFSKAFIWHLSEAELWQLNQAPLGYGPHDCQGSLTRCVDCVRALWYLGRKSDMARNIARVLSRALAVLEARNT